MVNLATELSEVIQEVERQFASTGMAVIQHVILPNSFEPIQTDLVVLQLADTLEIYVDSRIQYLGQSTQWRRIMAGTEYPGHTRQVLQTSNNKATALETMQHLLAAADTDVANRPRNMQRNGNALRGPRSPTPTRSATAHDPEIRERLFGLLEVENQLYEALRTRVRGQDPSLRTLARRTCRHMARRQPRRPATIFCVGPTGVGKTKTAESLAAALHSVHPNGTEYGYVRLDMAEYQESHRVSQLLGAPAGYVGYDDGAQLTSALAANPRTVVLFDEIDKAHPQVLRTLMNAMDAGRLSSPKGSNHQWEIDCKSSIFIFTANVDSSGILEDLEQRQGFDEPAVVDQLCRKRLRGSGLAPELIGRISCFLAFRPLSPSVQAEIAMLAIADVALEFGLRVEEVDPPAIHALLSAGRDTEYGARPIEYLVDSLFGEAFMLASAGQMDGSIAVRGERMHFTCVPLS